MSPRIPSAKKSIQSYQSKLNKQLKDAGIVVKRSPAQIKSHAESVIKKANKIKTSYARKAKAHRAIGTASKALRKRIGL